MNPALPPNTLKLEIPRHLQDYNGYCGPACAMMVLSAEPGTTVPAQQDLFRDIRSHAKQANDRRPIKSPAESLLASLSAHSKTRWRKVFDPVPEHVAALLVQAIESPARPCILLISKGMHWVTAFGRTLRDEGTVAGVLMRDPSWAGMPAFYGLSIYPEKSTFVHTASPCACLASDNPPGSVHERYMALEELVSPRGLQGSPDWEGKGALAIVPDELTASTVLPSPPLPTPAAAGLTPQAAALLAVREHGLTGRPDSPPDWDQLLDGGQAGTPILVKDPDDVRDDFYLVPIHPRNPASLRTAWIMLDPVTLKLREASLLDHWMVPAYPTDRDADNISGKQIVLADGTAALFKKSDLRPNQRNLIWKASGASILPYWPLREFIAPHPLTGEPTSLYVTQHGAIHTVLGPEETPATQPPAASPPPQSPPATPAARPDGKPWKSILGIGAAAAGIAVAAQHFLTPGSPDKPAAPSTVQVKPGTGYDLRATSLGPPHASVPSPVVSFTTREAKPHGCLPPGGIRADALVEDGEIVSVTVSWEPVPGAVSYQLEFFNHNNEWTVLNAAIKETRYLLKEIPHLGDATGAIRITTNCAEGRSFPSKSVRIARGRGPEATEDPIIKLLEDGIKRLTEAGNLPPEQVALLEQLRGLAQRVPEIKNPLQRAAVEMTIRKLLERALPQPQPKPLRPTPQFPAKS